MVVLILYGANAMYRFFKRAFDLCASIMAIVIFAIPMLIIATIIRIDSSGKAIFSQQRAGKNAKPFKIYKFRSMRSDVDPYGASPKSGRDPRITKIGLFLRETSLDELPQLFNVLRGEMSLVGPRPLYVEQIAEWSEHEKKRLDVKPGLTGLAQVSGRGSLTREAKLALDVEYVQNASFFYDIKIVLKTIWQIFKKDKIYEEKYSESQDTRGDES